MLIEIQDLREMIAWRDNEKLVYKEYSQVQSLVHKTKKIHTNYQNLLTPIEH